jgi:hypothetical protein
MFPLRRETGLFLLVAVAFVTVGRAPGAVQLRTREVEMYTLAKGKTAREMKTRSAWIERGDPREERA